MYQTFSSFSKTSLPAKEREEERGRGRRGWIFWILGEKKEEERERGRRRKTENIGILSFRFLVGLFSFSLLAIFTVVY